MKKFEAEKVSRSKATARESADVDLVALGKHMPHDVFTGEALQAYEEKLKRYKFSPMIKRDEWDTEKNESGVGISRRAGAGGAAPSLLPSRSKRRRSSTHEVAIESTSEPVGSSSRHVVLALSQESASSKRTKIIASEAITASTSSSREKIVRKSTVSKAAGSSRPKAVISRVLSSTSSASPTEHGDNENERSRTQMQALWNASLPRFTAKLYLVNNVDDEECPPVPDGFRYIETGYIQ